jgi:hypothetical protein
VREKQNRPFQLLLIWDSHFDFRQRKPDGLDMQIHAGFQGTVPLMTTEASQCYLCRES